jgi:CRISPR/Cas system-associated endonuclease/helicase Cas3
MQIEDKISVSLLLSGEYEGGKNQDSDIIVTNIDNFLSPFVNNSIAHTLVNIISVNVIFDEYHEFLCRFPLFSAFIGITYCRTHFTKTKTLLMSATPHRFDNIFWNTDKKYVEFIKPNTYNGQMLMNINAKNINSIKDVYIDDEDAFIITNTVKQAQLCFKNNRKNNDILLHSRFTQEDRSRIENYIYQKHGKNSIVENRNTVYGTNIIGTGLDISAKDIYEFPITPEATIQRACGRGGRFNEPEYNNCINYTALILSNTHDIDRLINDEYSNKLYKKWIDTIKQYDGKTITKSEFYIIYHNFNTDNEKDLTNLFRECISQSSKMLRKLKTYQLNKKNKKSKDDKVLSNEMGMRGEGDNVYIVARKEDGTISGPIIVSKTLIDDKKEKEKEAKKKRYNVLISLCEELKRKYKDWCHLDLSDCITLAANKKTPLYLHNFMYDPEIGLYEL